MRCVWNCYLPGPNNGGETPSEWGIIFSQLLLKKLSGLYLWGLRSLVYVSRNFFFIFFESMIICSFRNNLNLLWAGQPHKKQNDAQHSLRVLITYDAQSCHGFRPFMCQDHRCIFIFFQNYYSQQNIFILKGRT